MAHRRLSTSRARRDFSHTEELSGGGAVARKGKGKGKGKGMRTKRAGRTLE